MFAAQGAGPADRVSVVRALLAAGARVNDVTSRGHSSLMFGCSRGRDDTVRALLAAGAFARVRSVTGEVIVCLGLYYNGTDTTVLPSMIWR
jgi:ankyrin repeat protein